ncbi:MAG: hypothetical protein R2737_07555 [Candidatus Nanopelagicales bacterium]
MLGLSDCEALGTGWWVQPVNAWSSLAFVLAGVWLLVATAGASGGRRTASWAYAGGLALVGVGSLLYHGPQPGVAVAVHDGSLVVVVALAVGVPLVRALRGCRVLPGATRRRVVTVMALGMTALVALRLGRTGSPLCDQASWVQWHAAWHLLAAATLAGWGLLLFTGKTPADSGRAARVTP